MKERLKRYLRREEGDEAIEKVILIGAAVVLSLAVIGFMTYQINQGAKNGKDAMNEAIQEGLRP